MEVDTSNSEVIVFYVNENGTQQEVYSAIQNIDASQLQTIDASQLEQYETNYVVGINAVDEVEAEASTSAEQVENQNVVVEVKVEQGNRDIAGMTQRWLDEETRRLLVFYTDNKEVFTKANTNRKHLWSIACKTILKGKTPDACDIKLHNLKRNYSVIRIDLAKGKPTRNWNFYEMCDEAFQNDAYIDMLIKDALITNIGKPVPLLKTTNKKIKNEPKSGILELNKQPVFKAKDAEVEEILNLYLKYSRTKSMSQSMIWEVIGNKVKKDPEACRKRFLNFKQHYIKILEKIKETGYIREGSNWPYLKLFEQIYANDVEFQKKYGVVMEKRKITNLGNRYNFRNIVPIESSWNDTEQMVLVKYCYDCYDEFQDPTIPKDFLWGEVSRLLYKLPEMCKNKYIELKTAHLNSYIAGEYDHLNRKAISIIFDNLISKDTELILSKFVKPVMIQRWPEAKVDALVHFFYDNLVLFKDRLFHFVCWAAVRRKLNMSLHEVFYQWVELTTLYRSLLEIDRSEDVEVDWKYIEMFDRIFDYGMDTKLLDCFDVIQPIEQHLRAKHKEEFVKMEESEETIEKTKKARGEADQKQLRILEYYLKNKEKFDSSHNRRKVDVWASLARELGLTPKDCAHRFRNLKQVYMTYVQREIDKPEMPILWPYYAVCKKVFGHRAVKNKLRNTKADVNVIEEWSTKEIKQIITYFSQNFENINKDPMNLDIWNDLASQINYPVTACIDKFLELRKSYRKVRSAIEKNPNTKVNWKYYKMFEALYEGSDFNMDVDIESDEEMNVKDELDDLNDDDYQCIIVLPEGEDISQLHPTVTPPTQPDPPKQKKSPFTKAERIKLVQCYLEYVQPRQGKIINTKDMWTELANILNRNKNKCRRVYYALKKKHLSNKDETGYRKTEICQLFEQILDCKLMFYRPRLTIDDIQLPTNKPFRNYVLPLWKVEEALKFYLENLELFFSPQYEEKYLWNEMAQKVSVPVSKLYEKIQYLKLYYDVNTGLVDNEKVEFGHLIQEIYEKEFALKLASSGIFPGDVKKSEKTTKFDDDDRERLLVWYLQNLERFKDPKYVRSFLWKEASLYMQKTPLACSKQMLAIRNQYKTMMKNSPEDLTEWRFYDLCQKIYGTGKKSAQTESADMNAESQETVDETKETGTESLENMEEAEETATEILETSTEALETSETEPELEGTNTKLDSEELIKKELLSQ